MVNRLNKFLEEHVPALIGGTFIAVYLACVGSATMIVDKEKKEANRVYGECSQLISKAKLASAGEDRIWTTAEKRKFLDYFKINEPIGEGQDIYFRVNPGVQSDPVEVVGGYNLENNGGLLHGSSAKSGTSLGRIPYSQLVAFVRENSGVSANPGL